MIRKFITYQDLLQSDLPATMPQELLDFFHLHLNKHSEGCVTDGSVEQTHVESFSLLEYSQGFIQGGKRGGTSPPPPPPLSKISPPFKSAQVLVWRARPLYGKIEVW